ncbi:hypothetical protein C0J52_17467 [Blattella germanica]|nr:hypothetical protein C0J52_17467 [Blattella germanica]
MDINIKIKKHNRDMPKKNAAQDIRRNQKGNRTSSYQQEMEMVRPCHTDTRQQMDIQDHSAGPPHRQEDSRQTAT